MSADCMIQVMEAQQSCVGVSELQKAALANSLLACETDKKRQGLANKIEELTEKDAIDLETAKMCAVQVVGRSDDQTVLRTYQLIKDMRNDMRNRTSPKIDLECLILQCTKPGVELSVQRVRQYTLEVCTTDSFFVCGYDTRWTRSSVPFEKQHEIYMDAPVGIGLLYCGKPQAVVAFTPYSHSTLMIVQLQGVRPLKRNDQNQVVWKGHSRSLAPLDWERLLVEYTAAIANEKGFVNLGIRSAYNNKWAKPEYGIEGPLKLEAGCRRYDELARRLRFAQNGCESQNWYQKMAKFFRLKRWYDMNWYKKVSQIEAVG